MKHSLFTTAAACALLALTGAADAKELKISHVRPQGAQIDLDINAYADEVATATGGDVTLRIFPASALGNYTTVQEKISLGAIDMAIQPGAAGVDRRMQISYFPYLAQDYAHAEKLYGKGGAVRLAGTVQGIRKMRSKRGKAYAFLSLSDSHGGFEVTLFSELLEGSEEVLVNGTSLIIRAEVKRGDDGALRITAQGLETIDSAAQRSGAGLDVYIKEASNLETIKELLDATQIFSSITVEKDLSNNDRVVIAMKRHPDTNRIE